MQIHDLIQGSPEWLAYRLEHDNASEIAAVLGLSKTTTRTELMHAKHTGLGKEFSDWVQSNVLDYGHEVEAKVRPLVEALLGDDLYPVTCSNGRLSASLDGLTMSEVIAFECKQWNVEIAAQVSAGIMPEQHMPQCQQILMVTGAKKLIFAVGDGTPENLLTLDVFPDQSWFDRIRAAWDQFAIDLAAYVPPAVVIEAVGRTPETLPALFIELTGAVTASNLDSYKDHALSVIGAINRNLQTDQDFADATKAVKWCGEVESRLKAVKEHALSQTQTIDQLFKAIDDITAKARDTRLDLGKLVDRRNTERKEEIVLGGKNAYQAHLESLKTETDGLWVTLPTPDFAGVIKGMRLFSNMQDAVNTLLANSKITADDSAKKIRGNLALLAEAKEHAFLFNDRGNLISKAADDLKLLIKSRISDHQAAEAKKEADQRERIRAEEVAKLAREQAERDRVAAEQASAEANAQAQADAEARRASEVAIAKAKAETPPALEPLAQAATETVALTPPTQADFDDGVVDAEVVLTGRMVSVPMKIMSAPAVDTGEVISLGQIGERLGFALKADFLKELGFEPCERDKKRPSAILYRESAFPSICTALMQHIHDVCELVAA